MCAVKNSRFFCSKIITGLKVLAHKMNPCRRRWQTSSKRILVMFYWYVLHSWKISLNLSASCEVSFFFTITVSYFCIVLPIMWDMMISNHELTSFINMSNLGGMQNPIVLNLNMCHMSIKQEKKTWWRAKCSYMQTSSKMHLFLSHQSLPSSIQYWTYFGRTWKSDMI